MRAFIVIAVLWASAVVQVNAAEPAVQVSYDKNAQFTDPGDGLRDVENNIGILTRHLQNLGKKHLPPGQQLRIEIVQLDLAGRIVYRSPQRIRVVNDGADWPRIDLRYVLSGPGGEIRRGDDSLIDQNFFRTSQAANSEPLRYEKRMLTKWFKERFVAAKP